MGGTTFDVSALRGRQLVVTPEATFGMEMLGIPKIDVRSVGAGGGSIAWVDAGGLLRVGPQSAGARPGPACYGLGGTEADGDRRQRRARHHRSGLFPRRQDQARPRARPRPRSAAIAKQLKLKPLDAAYAIYTTSNHNMIAAIEDITVNEGIDPRDSLLSSAAAARPPAISARWRACSASGSFMVPKFAAGLSAFGGLISDVRWEETGDPEHDGPRLRARQGERAAGDR